MGKYTRKDGTVVITKTVDNKAMNKRGLSKIVHVIPPHPEFKTEFFAKRLASFLGPDFVHALSVAQQAKKDESDKES